MKGKCHGACKTFKNARPNGFSFKTPNQVRCRTCCMAYIYEGLWCPCCDKRVSRRGKKGGAIKNYVRN